MVVNLNDVLVKVVIIRNNNKNIYFRFDDNLNLIVSANKRIKEKEILKLIKKNELSLGRLLNKAQKRVEKQGEFWYLGNKYTIQYENITEVQFRENIVYAKDEKMLNSFLKQKMGEIFLEEVNNLRKVIATPDFTLKIRKMKTRWGVCNYKNMTITLNSELIKYSISAIRYVIIHEMCHFEEHNHGANFWKKVSRYEPNYKEIRKELRG